MEDLEAKVRAWVEVRLGLAGVQETMETSQKDMNTNECVCLRIGELC